MLKTGIIGMPNVGKSTLFNALIHMHKAEASNYPFCTIDANVGSVVVPDTRLQTLAELAKVSTAIPTTIEFVDIAGLVKGASKGEGLGNKFLSHIREMDALIHLVRCFEDANVHHVTGSIDPIRDIEIVHTELILADMETVHKRCEKLAKDVKHGDKKAIAELDLLHKIQAHLNQGKMAHTFPMCKEEKAVAKGFFLLSDKPELFAANVNESDLIQAENFPSVKKVRDYALNHQNCGTVVISAQLESDLIDLSPEESREYLKEIGLKESGVSSMIQAVYQLLGLRTFFTFNEKEARAWTIHGGDTAPKAAGVIHTDFERGFIKAETIALADLIKCGSVHSARERGVYRMEGKDYTVQDGDVILFKFHV